MFKDRVIAELKKVVGWNNHWNTTDIPALPSTLTDSLSGMKYQNFLPSLVRLDYIQAMLPSDRTLEEFLDQVETDSINMVLAELVQQKQIGNNGNDIVANNVILQSLVRGDAITNESRFVGIEISLKETFGIEVMLNRIGLYLNGADTDIELYLFNSLQPQAIATYTIPALTANSFQWLDTNISIEANVNSGTDGGVWYIGYYQDDLAAQAISLKTFNWRNGYCASCTGESVARVYREMIPFISMTPFYIATANVPTKGDMFDIDDMVETYDNNWGLNINLSVKCDLSQYFIDNKLSFKIAIGNMVAYQILQMLSASSQVSALEQNIQPLSRDTLEGITGTKTPPFKTIVSNAIKAIELDQGSQNDNPCLPCARKGARFTHA